MSDIVPVPYKGGRAVARRSDGEEMRREVSHTARVREGAHRANRQGRAHARVSGRFARECAEVVASTPDYFRKLIASDIALWDKVIREMGIKAD